MTSKKVNDKFVFNHNYHSHCELCRHADGTVSDYCDEAYRLGFLEWGVSDHGPLAPCWQSRMTLDEFLTIYLPEIELNQKKYQGKMKIYKSLELEYYPEYDLWYRDYLNRYHLDYLILGQHALYKNGEWINTYKGFGLEEAIEYKNEVVSGLNSGYFKILAHPDLFMLSFTRANQTWTKELDDISREIIEAAIKNNVYLELNVNGARRQMTKNEKGEDTWLYPYLNFWRIAAEYKDAKFILGSDSHKVSYLTDGKDLEVIDFCNKLGIKLEEKIIL